MWTNANRARYERRGLRYPSDLTDEEWALIRPLIPPAKRGGNKRTVDVRAVVNGVMYVLSTGCQWAALPTDLPPRSTVNDYFRRWDWDGTLMRIHHALYVQCREAVGREGGRQGPHGDAGPLNCDSAGLGWPPNARTSPHRAAPPILPAERAEAPWIASAGLNGACGLPRRCAPSWCGATHTSCLNPST